jgi:colanic acid/amylovoran biosynthesis glycosyltransferase
MKNNNTVNTSEVRTNPSETGTPLSVAFFIGVFPKISETWFIEQVTSLIDLGVDVRLFAFERGTAADVSDKVHAYRLLERTTYLDIPKKHSDRLFGAAAALLQVIIRRPRAIPRIFAQSRGKGVSSFLKYLFWARPLLGKIERYPIVHCHFGMIANRYLILKDVLDLRQPFVTTFYGQDSSKYIKAKGVHVYDRLKRECALILTMTDEMTERLVAMGFPHGRVRTHYTGIVLANYTFTERVYVSPQPFLIAFIGRFVEKKGIPDLLRAFSFVIEKNPQAELHLFGGGDDAALNAEIDRLVREHRLELKTVFHGLTPNVRVLEELTRMHLIVQLSRTATNGDTDDLPVALLEGQASGLPAVTTRHVGIPDGIEDGR